MPGGEWDTAHWAIFVAVILIVLYALTSVFGPKLIGEERIAVAPGQDIPASIGTEVPSGEFEAGAKEVLFHPKVLGAALLLLIATFTIMKIAE